MFGNLNSCINNTAPRFGESITNRNYLNNGTVIYNTKKLASICLLFYYHEYEILNRLIGCQLISEMCNNILLDTDLIFKKFTQRLVTQTTSIKHRRSIL